MLRTGLASLLGLLCLTAVRSPFQNASSFTLTPGDVWMRLVSRAREPPARRRLAFKLNVNDQGWQSGIFRRWK
jgi:hypothetical protein